MTPELKKSCEIVFQEHKASTEPVLWNKNIFHGRMSIGLAEMAKETLVEKKVIYFPKPNRKTVTMLSPLATTALSFEEAIAMAQKKIPARTLQLVEETQESASFAEQIPNHAPARYAAINAAPKISNGIGHHAVVEEKWWLKPIFYYVIWPLAAAIGSVLIAWLMGQCVEMMYR